MDRPSRQGHHGRVSLAPAEPSNQNDHSVLFYERDEELTAAAARFCSDGLGVGDAVLVVATGAHRRAIRSALVDDHRGLARVGELEATTTLERITDDEGGIEGERFFDVMEPALATVARSSASGSVRVFGEMVSLLVARNDPHGALALEGLWNELARGPVPFSLLCGYRLSPELRGFDETWIDRLHQVHRVPIQDAN